MPSYTDRYVRFGAAALSLGVLLFLLAKPVWPVPPLSAASAARILPSVAITGRYLGIGLLFALPIALLLGIPAGLWAGSRLSRTLTLPLSLVAGVPIPVLAMLLFPLSLWSDLLSMTSLAGLLMALVTLAWVTPAIRDRVAKAREGLLPKLMAVTGAIFGQAGTLFVAVAVMEAFFPLGGGIFRLVADGVRAKEYGLFLAALALFAAPVLLLHLAGDLLVPRSQGRTSARRVGSAGWTALGLLLTLVLVVAAFATLAEPAAQVTAKSLPPGNGHLLGTDRQGRDLLAVLSLSVRNAVKHAGYGTIAALIAGAVIGSAAASTNRWSRMLLKPGVTTPSLFGPFLALVGSALLLNGKSWSSIFLVGAICAPALAPFARPVLRPGPWAQRRLALLAALGAAVQVFTLLLGAETAAYQFRTFDGSPGLFGLISATLGMKTSPYQYWAILIVAVGTAGLGLLSASLRSAYELEPDHS